MNSEYKEKTVFNYGMGKEWKKFDTQRYPLSPNNYYKNEINFNYSLINKKTSISSIGSCFARRIKSYLINNDYNYLVVKEEKEGKRVFSANWGTVYNLSCLRQIFQYSFEEFNPKVRWWPKGKNVLDPFRKDIMYREEEKDEAFSKHAKNSKFALSNIETMIITLGMTEVWRDKRDLSTFWRVVPKKLYNPKIHEFHIMGYDECLNELVKIKNLFDKHNSNCNLIFTISPVPFFATFRTDIDPVSANFNSKATLKSAVDYFVRNTENTYYFPSFEYATYGFNNSYKNDNRHVQERVVKEIMQLFEKMFVKGEN